MSVARIVVVGGGLAGLVIARRLARALPSADITVLERAERCGGLIRTERAGGFVVEEGPDSFLTTKTYALDLCHELGIAGELESTVRHRHRAFIHRDGRLRPIPDGLTGIVPIRLGALLASGVLTLEGCARFAAELVLPPGRNVEDESIASFIRRRFGREAYDWLFEPLLAGIHGGDAEQLSVRATFPALHAAEVDAGSVLAGLREAAAARQQARAGARAAGGRTGEAKRRAEGATPPGEPEAAALTPFVTLRSGMQRLIEALLADLGNVRVHNGARVHAVRAAAGDSATGGVTDSRWVVAVDGRDAAHADAVVLAVPAHAASPVVRPVAPELADTLAAIPYAASTIVHLAFGRSDCRHTLAGHGYLNPRASGRRVAACTWTSSKFAHRAPPEAVLLRMFVRSHAHHGPGAARGDDRRALDHEERADPVHAALDEAREVLGIVAPPLWQRVLEWPASMPQYTVGHLARLAVIDRALAGLPGLFVTGNAYRGVGIPDTIHAAESVAERVRTFVEES